jgi:hypothetical protein
MAGRRSYKVDRSERNGAGPFEKSVTRLADIISHPSLTGKTK